MNGDGGNDYSEVVLSATNRRGKQINCKVMTTALLGLAREVRGVILMMEEQSAPTESGARSTATKHPAPSS